MRPFLGLLLLPVSLLLCAPYAMPQKGSRSFPQPNPKPPRRLVPIKTPNVSYPDEAVIQAVLDSTKLWEFVPPDHAAFIGTASVSYAFPKPCSGPEADGGEVEMGGRLTSERGNVIGVDDQLDSHLPAYPNRYGRREAPEEWCYL